MKIVYDRILSGFQIPELEDARLDLSDMGLLTKSEPGELTISESEKQNIVRFFNRLLSLEVERQNALFDYFYKTYTETVEHLKASGKYDLGLEDIKAKSVKIRREPQLIHPDRVTSAETLLYELETIVATTPAHFDDLERAGSLLSPETRLRGTGIRRSACFYDSHRPGDGFEFSNLCGQPTVR